MSEKTNDGGPAFPVEHTYDGMPWVNPGMTLRDWFAGEAIGECFAQALARGFTSPQDIDTYTERAAFWAYRLAEAMLVERGRLRPTTTHKGEE